MKIEVFVSFISGDIRQIRDIQVYLNPCSPYNVRWNIETKIGFRVQYFFEYLDRYLYLRI